MDDFLEPQTLIIEQLAFVSAAASAARFDEAVKGVTYAAQTYIPAAIRREAAGIAALEGANPRRDNLVRLLGNRELTNIERDTKLAADIFDSLSAAGDLFHETPGSGELNQLFMLSDTSSGRLMRADVVWSIEEDCQWLSEQIALLEHGCNPWTAVECLRHIWTSGRFIGKARRITMIVAPWILKLGFSCDTPLFGIANEVRLRIDLFREAAQTKEEWEAQFATAIHKGVQKELQALRNVAATRATLEALCPSARSSSSIPRAIEFMMGSPAFLEKTFSEKLNLTRRGAKDVLDRLVDADVLEIEGGPQNRLFLCRRTI